MSIDSVSQKPPASVPAHLPNAAASRVVPPGAPARSFKEVLAARLAKAHGAPQNSLSNVPPSQWHPHASQALLGALEPHHGDARVVERAHPTTVAHEGRVPEDDALDPHTRLAAQLAPPMPDMPVAATSPGGPMQAIPPASLEALLPQLVRHIAWSKDGARKGTVRMEFGAGALAGGSMIVHADNGKVAVQLDVPAGQDHAAWRDRIRAALERRGLHASDIEIS